MSVALLLQELRERGIELVPAGDRLRSLAPQGALTPELAARIREYKDELIALLTTAAPAAALPKSIPRVPERSRYALSPVQRRNVFGAHQGPGLPTAFRLRGPLSIEALRDTLVRIVRRHAPLRTTFKFSGDTVFQQIEPEAALAFEVVDLSPEVARAALLAQRLSDASVAPFDLEKGPPYRFALFVIGAQEHVFFMTVSPVVFDGWSFDVFLTEMREGYAALAAGRDWPFPVLDVEYVDFLDWQRARLDERRQVEFSYWRTELGQVLPRGPLPTDRPRPAVPSHRGASLPFSLPAELTEALRVLAQRSGSTLQLLMLAALHVFLARIGGVTRVVVATPIDGRIHPAVEPLIGSFVKLLLIPSTINPVQTFVGFAESVRHRCLTAYDHQELPLEDLGLKVEQHGAVGMLPLWQVEFSYQQVSTRGTLMGPLSLSQVEVPAAGAASELTLWVKDWGHVLGGAVDFAVDVFDSATVAHWRDCYCALLASIVATPEARIGELGVMGDAERAVFDTAMSQAIASPPSWLAKELGTFGNPTTPMALSIVDARGEALPGAAWGQLRLDGVPLSQLPPVRLRLSGALEQWEDVIQATQGASSLRTRVLDHVEFRVMEAFAKSLAIESVGLQSSFFDLGGHSLAGVRLLGSVQEEFGVRLALGVLFEAPTPFALAKLVRDAAGIPDPETGVAVSAEKDWSSVVPIQPRGNKPPLFVVAGVGGNPMNLRDVARALGDNQPFYGLQHRGTDGRLPPHKSVQAMADEYVEHIRLVCPKGPYFIGGFSAGGVAAYEVGQLLRAQGESVGLLVMFDAKSTLVRRPSRTERLSRQLELVRKDGAKHLISSARRRATNVTENIRLRAQAVLARWQPYRFRNEAVTMALVEAMATYKPEPYDGNVLLLRARIRDDGVFDATNGWESLVRGSLEVREVDGGHTSHIEARFAPALATVLAAALAAALLKCQEIQR